MPVIESHIDDIDGFLFWSFTTEQELASFCKTPTVGMMNLWLFFKEIFLFSQLCILPCKIQTTDSEMVLLRKNSLLKNRPWCRFYANFDEKKIK